MKHFFLFFKQPFARWMCIIIFLSLLPMVHIFTTSDLPHTSDGAMHLARIASYYKEITRGQFPVRWAGDLNYGYGTPIFNFFHPLPYMITSIMVGLGASLTLALKLSFLLSFIFSGIGMYLLAHAVWKDTKIAVVVSILYQFAPFRLVDILVRGSLGGIYAYTLLPFVLFGVVRFLQSKKYSYLWVSAFACAGLAISHNIVGFVFFGVAFLFTCFFPSGIRPKIITITSLFLGIGIAAFFVIPAIVDHTYTYGYLLTKNLFYDHFAPFFNFFLPNFTNAESLRIHEVSVQIGIVHLTALIFSLILLIKNNLSKIDKMITLFCIILFFITLFFMQPMSKPLWEHLSVLRQFQYPWRLLSVITFLTALSGFALVRILKSKTLLILFMLIAVFSTIRYWIPPQGYQTIQETDYWNYPLTTNYYGEVDTIWSDGPAKSYPKERIEVIAGIAQVRTVQRTSINHAYSVTAQGQATLRDNTQYFPGWSVLVNGINTPIQFQDANNKGVITFEIPNGNSEVSVRWKETKIRQMADSISIISIIIVILFPLLFKKQIAQS